MVFFQGGFDDHYGERRARMEIVHRVLHNVLDRMAPECKVFLGTGTLALIGLTLWNLIF